MIPMIRGYVYLGAGPQNSGTSGGGWSRSDSFLYVCSDCGGQMPANHNDYYNCTCGHMHLDIDYGRFGHNKGDDAILVYRKAEAAIQQVDSEGTPLRGAPDL